MIDNAHEKTTSFFFIPTVNIVEKIFSICKAGVKRLVVEKYENLVNQPHTQRMATLASAAEVAIGDLTPVCSCSCSCYCRFTKGLEKTARLLRSRWYFHVMLIYIYLLNIQYLYSIHVHSKMKYFICFHFNERYYRYMSSK